MADTRPPSWHYGEADRLLAEIATERAPVIIENKIKRAHIHALLAQCQPVEVPRYVSEA